jgi:hypothetical protein
LFPFYTAWMTRKSPPSSFFPQSLLFSFVSALFHFLDVFQHLAESSCSGSSHRSFASKF